MAHLPPIVATSNAISTMSATQMADSAGQSRIDLDRNQRLQARRNKIDARKNDRKAGDLKIAN